MRLSTLTWSFVCAGVAQGQSNCLVSSGSGVRILPPAPAFLDQISEGFRAHAAVFGEVPKWPKGADCKSAGERLQRFKSSPPHHFGARGRARGNANERDNGARE